MSDSACFISPHRHEQQQQQNHKSSHGYGLMIEYVVTDIVISVVQFAMHVKLIALPLALEK